MKKILIKLIVVLMFICLVSCSSGDEWKDDNIDNIKINAETLEIYSNAVEPYLGLDLVHDGIDLIPEKYRGYQKNGNVTVYRFECRDSYHKKYMMYINVTDGNYVIDKIENDDGNDVTKDVIPKSF